MANDRRWAVLEDEDSGLKRGVYELRDTGERVYFRDPVTMEPVQEFAIVHCAAAGRKIVVETVLLCKTKPEATAFLAAAPADYGTSVYLTHT